MWRFFFLVLSLSFFLIGCDKKDSSNNGGSNNNGGNNSGNSSISCTLTASSSTVTAGTATPLTVTASGGVAPYAVLGQSGSFGSGTQISRTYSNSSSSSVVVTDSVTVLDSQAHQASCSVNLTVLPIGGGGGGGGGGNLQCSLTASNTSPQINENVLYGAAAWGGSGSYVFSQFQYGNNAVITQNLQSTTTSTASAAAKYIYTGLSTASVKVQDGNGNSTTCSVLINVQNTVSTPVCSISYDSGTYYSGDLVNFHITASSGEALTVTELNIQDGYYIDFILNNHPHLKFNSSGWKTVSAKAKSTATGIACNSGSYLQTSINIGTAASPLTCSVSTSPSSSYAGDYVTANVVPFGSVGTSKIINVTSSYNSGMSYNGNYSNLSAQLYFPYQGSFTVNATIQDGMGRTALCSTTQVVYDYYNCWYDYNGYLWCY